MLGCQVPGIFLGLTMATVGFGLTQQAAGISAEQALRQMSGEKFLAVVQLARHGNRNAEAMLAYVAYEQGIHVPQNITEAAHWFRKLAQQGDPQGQHHLAEMYGAGGGVNQSYEEAAMWYRRAAALGYVPSQVNLANLYLSEGQRCDARFSGGG